MLQEAQCEVCKGEDETADHIFSGCTFVRNFWETIGWRPEVIAKVTELWKTQLPPRVHKKAAHPLIILCCGRYGDIGTMSSSEGWSQVLVA